MERERERERGHSLCLVHWTRWDSDTCPHPNMSNTLIH